MADCCCCAPCSSHPQRVKESLPAGSGVGDIAKALGAEWKALTAEQKAPYEERANEDKVLLWLCVGVRAWCGVGWGLESC